MPHSQLCCCSGGWLESWRGWNCQLEHLGVATAAWQHQGGPAFRVVIHDSERHGLEAAGFLEPGPRSWLSATSAVFLWLWWSPRGPDFTGGDRDWASFGGRVWRNEPTAGHQSASAAPLSHGLLCFANNGVAGLGSTAPARPLGRRPPLSCPSMSVVFEDSWLLLLPGENEHVCSPCGSFQLSRSCLICPGFSTVRAVRQRSKNLRLSSVCHECRLRARCRSRCWRYNRKQNMQKLLPLWSLHSGAGDCD